MRTVRRVEVEVEEEDDEDGCKSITILRLAITRC